MTLSIENDLIPKVRTLIDEVAHDATEDFSSDLDAEIRNSIIMAAQKMKRDLGRAFLLPVSFDRCALTAGDDGIGTATMPDDFGTLVEFQLKGWLQPVTDFIEPGSAEAKQQMHPWTRGSASKPVAMVTLSANGVNSITYFCAQKQGDAYRHELDHFHYIPVIDDSTEVLPIADEAYDMLLYQSAALLMLSKGETEIAGQLASMGSLTPQQEVAETE